MIFTKPAVLSILILSISVGELKLENQTLASQIKTPLLKEGGLIFTPSGKYFPAILKLAVNKLSTKA